MVVYPRDHCSSLLLIKTGVLSALTMPERFRQGDYSQATCISSLVTYRYIPLHTVTYRYIPQATRISSLVRGDHFGELAIIAPRASKVGS